MKILYYSPHPHHDIVSDVGYSVHQLEMIQAFEDLGHEVHKVIMGGDRLDATPDYVQKQGQGAPLKNALKSVIPKVIWNSLRDYFRFIRHDKRAYAFLMDEIARVQPDLIYERSEYLLRSGVDAAIKTGIPHVLEVNAPFIEEWESFEGKNFFKKRADNIEKFKLQNTSLVSCISSVLKENLIDRYELKNVKFKIITNGSNPDNFNEPKPLATKEIKERFNLEDKLVVGFVGSIMPYHKVDKLIYAFARANRELPNRLKLLVVGGGAGLEELEALASELGIEDETEFSGQMARSEISTMLHAMDICVLPSTNWYCSPIKLFEYALCAKAIIAPSTHPIQEVFTSGRDAYLVDDSEDALTDAIFELAQNDELRISIGLQARTMMLKSYLWTTLAENTLKELEESS